MALTVTKIHAKYAAEVGGVRLAEPVDGRTFAAITDAFNEYSELWLGRNDDDISHH